jgi:ferrous iron transport protein B
MNTILTFTPQIAALFFCLSLLERSGYMARAAFVMDRLMQWVGLPGKSFVPLIIGFGCNVPAIMAARTLDVHRDRIMTILMAPFMSCGARLAIFAVFASAFFPHSGASVVFGLYVIGIVVALLTGVVMKYTLLRGESSPFIMELPPYHRPMFRIVLMDMLRRLQSFVVRAGQVILPFCLLIGCLNMSTWQGQSVLENIGKKMTPLFSPMGITEDNWPATVGLLTGTVAKEVVIGTLNTLYTQNNSASQDLLAEGYHPYEGLKQALRAVVEEWRNDEASSPQSSMDRSAMGRMLDAFGSRDRAFVYMLFVLLYIPCISTIAAAAREAGHGWSLLSTGWSISIAYCLSVACYQLIHLFDHPLQTVVWCGGILLYLSCLIAVFVRWANDVNA